MDSLRGEFSGEGDSEKEDVAPAAPVRKPANDERRMQVRAYNFWASLLGEKTFPDIADLDPANLPDFGPRSVLLDFTGGLEDPVIPYVGAMLAEECGAGAPIRRITDVPGGSLLSRITDHYMQILANEAPIGFEAEYLNPQGMTVLYRGILMPFSRDGRRIDYIYGVINWKEGAEPLPARRPLAQIDDEAHQPAMLRAPEPLTDWADGPADFRGADFTLPAIDGYSPIELPSPGFAFDAEPTSFSTHEMGLADWLASARDLVLIARRSEERSHRALYEAIGRAHDFALAAQDAPEDLAELLEDAEIRLQDRAPLLALVKLVFGADYDKTRLTEFATVIAHAVRIGLPAGTLCTHLAATPGGVKALVREERRLRREEAGTLPANARERLAGELRAIEARPMTELDSTGEEFTLLVARRLPGGEIVLVGEVGDDEALLQRAARRLLG
ncbi:PAS domain-containing protein [Novosphingobium guangzhouense]|uniref:PAS domain-containing protein n=1 Tax=Novosphingobium guangzhouense TaxID=1850347 RepID=A0A2K2FSB8_9SPHN|nr:hypothetical protein [Novosphingobium guangzhouense]PNU01660.1 hypothetical protein A8V01_11350 [Novosphingobium guangzhouense]